MNLVQRCRDWILLGLMFWRELALSVIDVARTVIDPGRVRRSEIIAVPLDLRSDAGIALLANLITLTPGTTSLHVDKERHRLYVHVMNASGDSVAAIKSGFERRVRAVLR
ncbi:MAG: Na+/H+ antiporter subunit E [Lautropia sp.]